MYFLASHHFSFRAFLENLNFLLTPFSSTKTYHILVGFQVKGQINLTLETSIGFSNLTICQGLAQLFFTCLVTIFIHETKILLVSLKTFNTSACFSLSSFFQEIISTLSHFLIFIRDLN